MIIDMLKNTIVECVNYISKKFDAQLIKFGLKFRTLASLGQIHKEEG